MDNELQKLYNSFCLLKDKMNSGNVTEKTVNLIGRFGKAIKTAEDIVLDPPKINKSFEQNFKIESYIPKTQKELKEIADKIKEGATKKKPGSKPKKK